MSVGPTKLCKPLAKIATVALVFVFVQSSVNGMLCVALNARFVSTLTILNEQFVYGLLLLVYIGQFSASLAVVMSQAMWIRSAAAGVLVGSASFDVCLGLYTRDFHNAMTCIGMLVSSSVHFVDISSSRCERRSGGLLEKSGMESRIDWTSAKLRDVAGRYKIGSLAVFAIALVIMWTFVTSDTLRSESYIRYELAKAKWKRGFSLVSLIATLGSNDRLSIFKFRQRVDELDIVRRKYL
tara:strand:+ start:1018 stop:1734 length:717 start_codon:yes stop_codon:yes gene_type:complete